MKNHVSSGIMGLTVADALGVPVEFMDRRTLEKKSGYFNAGLWHI